MIDRENSKKLLLVIISALIVVLVDKLWAVQINLSDLFILVLVILLVVYFFLYQSKN